MQCEVVLFCLYHFNEETNSIWCDVIFASLLSPTGYSIPDVFAYKSHTTHKLLMSRVQNFVQIWNLNN